MKKYPLLRGKSKNKSVSVKDILVKLSVLGSLDETGPLTLDILVQRSIVPVGTRSVKIVYDKPLERSMTVQLLVSAHAAEAIKKAGGSVVS